MTRSSVFHRGRVPNRRLTAWSAGTGSTGATRFDANSAGFVGQALSTDGEGLTVIRIRGYFRGILLSTAAPNDGFAGAFGIGIASLAAVTAGSSSVPTPITEQGSENWLYWRAFSAQSVTSSISDGVNASSVAFSYEIDSKAMRKFPTDLAIYAMAEVVENGTSTMDVWHDSRVLVKLP